MDFSANKRCDAITNVYCLDWTKGVITTNPTAVYVILPGLFTFQPVPATNIAFNLHREWKSGRLNF